MTTACLYACPHCRCSSQPLDCLVLSPSSGLVVALPAAYFASRGLINGPLGRRLALLFLMGGTQGLVGWWMVRSGFRVSISLRLLLLLLASCSFSCCCSAAPCCLLLLATKLLILLLLLRCHCTAS